MLRPKVKLGELKSAGPKRTKGSRSPSASATGGLPASASAGQENTRGQAAPSTAGSTKDSAPSPPRGKQSLREFQALQRIAGQAIMRPLDRGWNMQKQWGDGQSTADVVSTFIKPNDRLTSFERIEIYNRQYWFRLLDCISEDFPGLEAILGVARCNRLFRAYLAKYPSTSYTLRNLGEHLPKFIADEPQWAGDRHALALEMAKFEWAQVLAFDSEAKPPVKIDDLLGVDPSKLRLNLQPYLSLVELNWPLDEYSIALKRRHGRGETSNATDPNAPQEKAPRRPRLPKPQHIFVAVHRLNNSLYYKRLDSAAFALLSALRTGQTLASACETAFAFADESIAGQIGVWFKTWASMGWFCKAK